MTATCSVDGCGKPTDRKGFCCAHYMRNHRYGSATFIKKREPQPVRLCAVDGCGNKHATKGYCGKHAQSFRRYADPLAAGPAPGFAADFFEETKKQNTDDCIFWPYAKGIFGYAVMRKKHGTSFVHRMMCIEMHGPCPSKQHEAAHECGNGHLGCINHRHLSWKTRSENQMDRVKHGTSNRGERQWNAKLNSDDVTKIIQAIRSGRKRAEVAISFDITARHVSEIMCGETWQWLTAIEPSHVRSDNKSGVVGVCWNKNANKWVAQITIYGRNQYLGYFDNMDDAIAARLAAENNPGYRKNYSRAAA